MGAALKFLAEPFEQVGGFEALLMGQRQSVEGEGALNVGFDLRAELGVLVLPAGEPGRPVGARPSGIAPVLEPAQFLQAGAVGRTRNPVEGIAQEVHVAALPQGGGQGVSHGFFRPA